MRAVLLQPVEAELDDFLSERPPLLSLRGVGKSFGPIHAVSNVDIDITAGEIHAVLGENGAGKTTLMRIIAGISAPSGGTMSIRGAQTVLRSRGDGVRQGIGIVQQHYGLVHDLTGVDNFLLGDPRVGFQLNRKQARQALIKTADTFDLAVHPDRAVGSLSIGERQRLEILIALASGAEILIFDEPTAALASSDVERLIAVMRRLAGEGKAIAYVTHKLREVMGVADRVTVMRRGAVAGRFVREEMSEAALTRSMIGELPQIVPVGHRDPGDVVLQMMRVGIRAQTPDPGLQGIDLEVRAGEVVGVAGVEGSGQTMLAEVAAGRRPAESGEVVAPEITGYIPEDRARDGLANVLSLAENAIVHRHADPALHSFRSLDKTKVAAFTRGLLTRGNVRANDVNLEAGALSGGNQQKLVVARELERKPDLVVAHNPYRGLDLGAAAEVRQRLLEERDRGCGILLISPDLDDLFHLASRIVVLSNGRIIGTVDPRTTTVEQLGSLIGGASDD